MASRYSASPPGHPGSSPGYSATPPGYPAFSPGYPAPPSGQPGAGATMAMGDTNNKESTVTMVGSMGHQINHNYYNNSGSDNGGNQFRDEVNEKLPSDYVFLRKSIAPIIVNHPTHDFDEIIADDLGVDTPYKNWKNNQGRDKSKKVQAYYLLDLWLQSQGNDATALGLIEALKDIEDAKLIVDKIKGKCLPSVELIKYQNGQLVFNPEAEKIIKQNNKPAEIISMLGQRETGKSYFLNRIKEGFPVFPYGEKENDRTRGVRMWVGDHPKDHKKSLVLLDIEGLNGNDEYDRKLITVGLLLCSTLIYSSSGNIDDDSLHAIRLLSQISEEIQNCHNADSSKQEFKSPLPKLVWSVSNYHKYTRFDHHNNTYLENSLLWKSQFLVSKEREKESNLIRERIKNCFTKRDCFLHPKHGKNNSLSTTSFDKLDSGFQKSSTAFVSFIHDQQNYKEIRGDTISPNVLIKLTENYVEAINRQKPVSVNSAFDEVMKIDNEKLFDDAIEEYQRQRQAIATSRYTLDHQHAISSKNAILAISDKMLIQTHGKHKEYVKKLTEKRLTQVCEKLFLQKYYKTIFTAGCVERSTFSEDLQLLENIVRSQSKETKKNFAENLMQYLWKIKKEEGWLDELVFTIIMEVKDRMHDTSFDLPPIEFITTVIKEGQGSLKINSLAMKILQSIDRPVEVVSVVGNQLSKKNQLLNIIRGRDVFPADSEETTGISMWIGDHPRDKKKTLILLETQGLGENIQHNNNMFTLAFLLSSTLIYNGNLHDEAPKAFMSSLSKHIQLHMPDLHSTKSSFQRWFSRIVENLSLIAPKLVVAGDQPKEELQKHNKSLEQLKLIFNDPTYIQLPLLSEKNLNPRLLINESTMKSMAGFEIYPSMIANVTEKYLDDINQSLEVKIETALESLFPSGFETVIEQIIGAYRKRIPLLPMKTSILHVEHSQASNIATEEYKRNYNQIITCSYQRTVTANMGLHILNNALSEEFKNLSERNNKESHKKSKNHFEGLYSNFKRKVDNGKLCSKAREAFQTGLQALEKETKEKLNNLDAKIMEDAQQVFTNETVQPLQKIRSISSTLQEDKKNIKFPLAKEAFEEMEKHLLDKAISELSNAFHGKTIEEREFLDILSVLLKEHFKQLKDINQDASLGKVDQTLAGYYGKLKEQAIESFKTDEQVFDALHLLEDQIEYKPNDVDDSTWEEAIQTFKKETIGPLKAIEEEFKRHKEKVQKLELPVVQFTLTQIINNLNEIMKATLTKSINSKNKEDFNIIVNNLLRFEEKLVQENNYKQNLEKSKICIQQQYDIFKKKFSWEPGNWHLDTKGCDGFIADMKTLEKELKEPINSLDPQCWNCAFKEIIGPIQYLVDSFTNYRKCLNDIPIPITTKDLDLNQTKILKNGKVESPKDNDLLDLFTKLINVEYTQKSNTNKTKSFEKCREVFKNLYKQFDKEFSENVNKFDNTDIYGEEFASLKRLEEKIEVKLLEVDEPIWEEVKAEFSVYQVKPIKHAEEIFGQYQTKLNNLKSTLPISVMDVKQKIILIFEEAMTAITNRDTPAEGDFKRENDEFVLVFEKLLKRNKITIEKENNNKNWNKSREILIGCYNNFRKQLHTKGKNTFTDALKMLETAPETNAEYLDELIWKKSNEAFSKEIVQPLQVVEKVMKMSNTNSLNDITLPITEVALKKFKQNIQKKALNIYEDVLVENIDSFDKKVNEDQGHIATLNYFKEITKIDDILIEYKEDRKLNVFQKILLEELDKEMADIETENKKQLDEKNEFDEKQYYILSNILSTIGLSELEDVFESKGITAENFPFLTEERLQHDQIGTTGQKLKILHYNKKLRDEKLETEKELVGTLQFKLNELEAKLEEDNCLKESLKESIDTAEQKVIVLEEELQNKNKTLKDVIEKLETKATKLECAEKSWKAQTKYTFFLQQQLELETSKKEESDKRLTETLVKLELKATQFENLERKYYAQVNHTKFIQENLKIQEDTIQSLEMRLNEANTNLENTNAKLENKSVQLENTNEILKGQIKQTYKFQEDLCKKENEILCNKKELEEYNKKLQNEIENVRIKTKELELSQCKFKTQLEEIDKLNKKIVTHAQEYEQLESNLMEVTDRLETKATQSEMLEKKLKAQVRHTIQLQEKLKMESLKLGETHKELQETIEKLEVKATQLENTENKYYAQVNHTKFIQDRLKSEQDKIKILNNMLEKANTNLTNINKKLEDKSIQLETTKDNLEGQIKQTFAFQEDMKIREKQLLDCQRQLEKTKSELKTEIDNVKLKTKEVEESKIKLKEQQDEAIKLQLHLDLKSEEADLTENKLKQTTERLEIKSTYVEMVEQNLKAQRRQTFKLQDDLKMLVDEELEVERLKRIQLESDLREAKSRLKCCPLFSQGSHLCENCKKPLDKIRTKEVTDKSPHMDSSRKLSMDVPDRKTPTSTPRRYSSTLSLQSTSARSIIQEYNPKITEGSDQKKQFKEVLKYYLSENQRLQSELDSMTP